MEQDITMEINENFVLQSVGLPALRDIAHQAAGVSEFELLDWTIEQIGGGVGNPVSVGLYRVAGRGLAVGRGRAVGKSVPWSTILKVIQSPANAGWSNMGEGADQTHWNYWKRELFVYRSGVLDTLPAGMAAPRCYATQELPGDMACLWLEEITDAYGDVWPLERYALAARHLGRLNGLYAGLQLLPDYPWIGQRRLHQWNELLPLSRSIPWDHPRVSARYPENEIANMKRVLMEAEDFIDRLDRLPQTFCHGDTYPTNFKSRRTAGYEQTVALDWGLAQVGPIGFDLGSLAFGAYLNLPERGLNEVDSLLFEAYMAGLRDSGYRAEVQQVRFGFAASAVLIIALFTLGMMSEQLQADDAVEIDATRPNDGRPCFEAMMADIACELRDLM